MTLKVLIWLIRRKRKRRKKRRRKRRKRRKNKCEVFYQILKIIMSSFKLIIAFQLFTTRTRNLSCQAPATLSAFFHQCGHLSKPISLSSNNLSAISSAYMIIRDTFLAIASTISGNLLLPQNSLPPLSSVLENSLASQLYFFLCQSKLSCRRSVYLTEKSLGKLQLRHLSSMYYYVQSAIFPA